MKPRIRYPDSTIRAAMKSSLGFNITVKQAPLHRNECELLKNTVNLFLLLGPTEKFPIQKNILYFAPLSSFRPITVATRSKA
jgi:hypothetical protein